MTIDDQLYRKAKAAAASSGRTVGQVIEDALRFALNRGPTTAAKVAPLPTFGEGGVLPGIDLNDMASVRDLLDEGVPLDELR